MLMGGCNEDTATAGLKKSSPPFNFTAVPIFLSSGASDAVATPEQMKAVELSMKASGFRNIRFETYPDTREVFPDHTTAALQWFTSFAAAHATATPKSDFDSFFKKN